MPVNSKKVCLLLLLNVNSFKAYENFMGFIFLPMRYHYEENHNKSATYGYTYTCDHPVYNRCTLYLLNGRGLAVIQQRYDAKRKATTWTEIDEWLVDDIFFQPGFREYFNQRAGKPVDRLYPTVSVRQIMWALKMKPLKKERWETVFDRKDI